MYQNVFWKIIKLKLKIFFMHKDKPYAHMNVYAHIVCFKGAQKIFLLTNLNSFTHKTII